MKNAIERLILKYQKRNKTILQKNPRLGIEFDWSGDAFELAHNEGFIRDLKKELNNF